MPRQNYSVAEAARALGVSIDTVRRWDRAGKLHVERDGANRRVVQAAEVERLRGASGDETISARNRFRGVVPEIRRGRRPARPDRDRRDRAGAGRRDHHERVGRPAQPGAGDERRRGRQVHLRDGGAVRRPFEAPRPRRSAGARGGTGGRRRRGRGPTHRLCRGVLDGGRAADRCGRTLPVRRLEPARDPDPPGRPRRRLRLREPGLHAGALRRPWASAPAPSRRTRSCSPCHARTRRSSGRSATSRVARSCGSSSPGRRCRSASTRARC